MSSIAGELITDSLKYDGGRKITVYIPPAQAEAIVFAGDGHLVSQWASSLEAADVPSTMIVAAHQLSDETLRLHEYSPSFEPERFAAHEKFLVEDVRGWVRERLGVDMPAERTRCSASLRAASWHSLLGLRHPDVYSAIFCASPGGGYKPPDVMPSPLPAPTSSREPWSRSSATTPPDG